MGARTHMGGPLLAVAAAAMALTAPLGQDYTWDAGPSVRALADLDLDRFFSAQPQMGSLSLLLRWPPALLADAFGGGEALVYRLGALPLLLAAAALGVVLARAMLARGAAAWTAWGVGALSLVNPVTFEALRLGHPEEVLGAALCVGALLAAGAGRVPLAGLLLGLALANKQWAVIAVLPVLAAAPAGRARLALLAGGVAGALTLPLAIADPHAFLAALDRPVDGISAMRPGNVWSLLVAQEHRIAIGGGEEVVSATVPGWLRPVAHPLIVGLAVALAGLFAVRRRGAPVQDALALLALVFLLRGMLDPWNHGYYHAPFLLALLAWEARRRTGLPVLTLLACAGLWLTFTRLAPAGSDATPADLAYVAWSVPLAGYLALAAFAPAALDRAPWCGAAPGLAAPRAAPAP